MVLGAGGKSCPRLGGVLKDMCDEGLAHRSPETSQPVMRLGFGKRDRGPRPTQKAMKKTLQEEVSQWTSKSSRSTDV